MGPPGPPPPRRTVSGATLLLTIMIGVLVIALIMAFFAFRAGGSSAAPPAGSESPVPQPTQPSAGPSEPTAEPSSSAPQTGVDPLINGWQVVGHQERGVVYEVPAQESHHWTVHSPTLISGFEDENGQPLVAFSGTAAYAYEFCGQGSERAATGTQGAGEPVDTAEFAPQVAELWAHSRYDSDTAEAQVTVGEPQPFEQHGLTGHYVTAEATVQEGTDCDPPTGVVHVVSFIAPDNEDDVYNFVLYADTGVDDALDPGVIEDIIGTLRPREDA
ncbi:hypothetical protein CLV72_109320 [Allonocardiopsis opalescens]|uniref:DUF8017 domain-containing protein n=1 Tax=Allonocardiopsis opalescens TaxID=1144618 RepID=A0A2T0PVZ8_9ACTN|nr:hypothetical protein CLV72_109320 [Allonocardiopsis opalescens]